MEIFLDIFLVQECRSTWIFILIYHKLENKTISFHCTECPMLFFLSMLRPTRRWHKIKYKFIFNDYFDNIWCTRQYVPVWLGLCWLQLKGGVARAVLAASAHTRTNNITCLSMATLFSHTLPLYGCDVSHQQHYFFFVINKYLNLCQSRFYIHGKLQWMWAERACLIYNINLVLSFVQQHLSTTTITKIKRTYK